MKYLVSLIIALTFTTFSCSLFKRVEASDKGTLILKVPDSKKWEYVKKDSFTIEILNKDYKDSLLVDENATYFGCEVEPMVDLDGIKNNIEYPIKARELGIEGQVIVKILIFKNGLPVRAKLQISDNPILNRAALSAVMKVRYLPAVCSGKYSSAWVHIPVNFKLID